VGVRSGGSGRKGRSGGTVASGGGNLSETELRTLSDYTMKGEGINSALFRGNDKYQDEINGLDRILDKSIVTKSETLYRGVQEKHFDQMVSDLKVGDTFTYKGYMSTTKSKDLAQTFSDWKGDKDLYVKVKINPGSKAIKIPSNARYADKREAGKETLVGRNQKFKYNGVTTTKNAMIINLESI
jgi:hypothetical protein